MRRWNRPYIVVGVAIALLLPLVFGSARSKHPLNIGLPRIYTGDEPHYLVLLNSIILDGDLDLGNNYAAVHHGEPQAGIEFSGSALAHHTVWFENGKRKEWLQTYNIDPALWDEDGRSHPVPRLRDDTSPPSAIHPEYSTHPPGIALLLAPFLFPLGGSAYLEPLAIFCSALAIVAAMLMFRGLICKYSQNTTIVDCAAVVAFLGTPAWHYGRTFFNEPFLLLFSISSYNFALRRNNPFVAGCFVALGVLMKPPFLLLAIPLSLMYVGGRKFISAALLALPILFSLGIIFSLNNLMFGSPWNASQEWLHGSFLAGMTGILFSFQYGYLMTAPAVVIAVLAWPQFFRTYPRDAAVLASGIILYFIVFASYQNWSGATCYGARYMVPILPLVFLSFGSLSKTRMWNFRWSRFAIFAICTLSIAINSIAAMPYWRYWDSNPLLAAWQSNFGG